MKPFASIFTFIIIFTTGIFLSTGCKKSAAPKATTTTDTTSLHYRISLLNTIRTWHITHHDATSTHDTTYFSIDTFALVFISDSVISPFAPYSDNDLYLMQYSQPNGSIWYSWNTGQSNIVDHADLYFYYTADSLRYYHIVANQGGDSWETTCTSTY